MIGSLVVRLEAKDDIKVKGLGGEALHGLLFAILRKTTVDVASNLHALGEQKPFSLSPFLEGHELKEGYSYIASGRTVAFKLSVLTGELFASAIKAFFNCMAEGEILTMSRKPLTVAFIDMCQTNPTSVTSFHELFTEAHTEPVITLEFVTPTSFKRDGIQVLFPEPQLVFASLLKRWNFFSEIKLPEEYRELLSLIKVSNYSLRTELIHFSKYKMIGFRGMVEYKLSENTTGPFWKAMNVLADFAHYAGVGAKTTMGMGQTRRINTPACPNIGVGNERACS